MRKVVAVLVQNGEVVAVETNTHPEPCKREGYPTGVGYEFCEWCQQHNHAEAKIAKQYTGGTVYLLGHYYACDPCLHALKASGMKLVIIKT